MLKSVQLVDDQLVCAYLYSCYSHSHHLIKLNDILSVHKKVRVKAFSNIKIIDIKI